MPPLRPPASLGSLRVWDLLLLSLLIPIAAAALQQQSAYPIPRGDKQGPGILASAAISAAGQWRAADSLDTRHSGQRARRESDVSEIHHKIDNARSHSRLNERALATVSPAEANAAAVRDVPAPRSAISTAGISRQPARSLQDWQVEDLMLLATVDGKLHARDRHTGASRWTLGSDREMVVMTRHPRKNRTLDERGLEYEDPLFIVEPTQEGGVYILTPGHGLQKQPYTVKQLADLAPWREDGPPAVQYTAEKKTALYTVDAATGWILDSSSASGSIVNEDERCKLTGGFEGLEEGECKTSGVITLGRTEYTIGISDGNTKEQIITLSYFEWETNKRDEDLQRQHTLSKDDQYVYTKFDGAFYAATVSPSHHLRSLLPAPKPIYRYKLSSPVVRVFDIVRRPDDTSGTANLALLSQPVSPSPNVFDGLEDEPYESVFLNCTESGNWYALSETNYPDVAVGAVDSRYYTDMLYYGMPTRGFGPELEREQFSGVYRLPSSGRYPQTHSIGEGPPRKGIEAPPMRSGIGVVDDIDPRLPATLDAEVTLSLRGVALICMSFFTLLAMFAYLFKQFKVAPGRARQVVALQNLVVADSVASTAENPSSELPMIRKGEPAMETILVPSDEAIPHVQFADAANQEATTDRANLDVGDEEDVKDNAEPAKKKATRGKRGGRKQKEKQQANADVKARMNGTQVLQAAEIISVEASDSPQISGPLQINSLIIHTDRVIGQGSCGTIVFQGTFEGRDVAVKRMLSQYYELASQEVSVLQRSDDHPNVVRYFCQQKDDHFLYIAVELCQASLFEVWEAENARDEARQGQLRGLKLAIQGDTTRTLQQLAAGLYHLHDLRIIHRDIKPQNILVGFPKSTAPGTRLLISDFGLGKNLPQNVSTLVDPTGNAGTSGWKAPELITQPRDTDSKHSQMSTPSSENGNGGSVSGVKRAADIFSLGCLFFWVLTDGVHPFEDENGWLQMRELNIKRGKKDMSALERWSDTYEPMQLITSMLEHRPEDRPTALAVLNHPYFWSAETRLSFLCDCSDHFEREPRGTHDTDWAGDSPLLTLLENRARDVIGERGDFLLLLGKDFVDTLGKQRKYSGNRLLDLLRAFRNKKHHYEDMSPKVQAQVGRLPDGYLAYWTNRFPRLLMACYDVVQKAGLQDSDRFGRFFAVTA